PGRPNGCTGPEPYVHILCASPVRRIGCHDPGLGQRGEESTGWSVRVHHHRSEGLDLSGSGHWRRPNHAEQLARRCHRESGTPGEREPEKLPVVLAYVPG